MATELGIHIGTRIKLAREAAGFRTQQALADKLPSPISNQYVSKWEKGVKPKEPTLRLIATAVGKEVAWFYEGFPKKNGAAPDALAALNGDRPLTEQALREIIADQIRLSMAERATREAEELRRIEVRLSSIEASLRRRRR